MAVLAAAWFCLKLLDKMRRSSELLELVMFLASILGQIVGRSANL
jgi:hypothetical protein